MRSFVYICDKPLCTRREGPRDEKSPYRTRAARFSVQLQVSDEVIASRCGDLGKVYPDSIVEIGTVNDSLKQPSNTGDVKEADSRKEAA